MVCKNCGNQLPDDALFCNNCGTRMNEAGPGAQYSQYGQHSPPSPPQANQPGTYYQPQSQYTPQAQYTSPNAPNTGGYKPPKNNTAKILIISLIGLCIVIAAILVIVLVKPFSSGSSVIEASLPPSIQDDASSIDDEHVSTDDNDIYVPDSDLPDVTATPGDDGASGTEQDDAVVPSEAGGQPSPSPSAVSTEAFILFDLPAWSTEPIYKSIEEGGVWTSVGLAINPNQVGGEDGKFYLADYKDCMYYIEFFNDLTWGIKYDEAGDTGVETALYEIMDIEYADIYGYDDTYGFRFYNGSDGRLYMCLYQIDDDLYPDISDFIVFEKKGDTVDWAADAAAD